MKNSKKIFFILYFLLCSHVNAEEGSNNFLKLPFLIQPKLNQGWFYNVKINGGKHGAIDYDCSIGDPIYASADGLAMGSFQMADPKYSFGNFIFIKHNSGYFSLYAHLNKKSSKIKDYPAEKRWNKEYEDWTLIKEGDYIGDCGMIGTTNDHLHFEVTTGGYATGRIDPYDLYKTAEYYPPNSLYTKMGDKHLWLDNPPSILILENSLENLKEDIVLNQAPQKISFFKKITSYFTSFFDSSDDAEVLAEKVRDVDIQNDVIEKKEDIKYVTNANIETGNIDMIADVGEDLSLHISAKNSGTAIWRQQFISLNVVGGVEKNIIFKHDSWMTDLRPTRLDQTIVQSGDIGSFSFVVHAPDEIGEYVLSLIIVEQSGAVFTQVGSDSIVIRLNVVESKEKTVEEDVDNGDNKNIVNVFSETIKGIKETSGDIIDDIVDTIKIIPSYIFSFGGGSSDNDTNQNNNVEYVVNENDNINIEIMSDIWLTIDSPSVTSTVVNATSTSISGQKGVDVESIFVNDEEVVLDGSTTSSWEYEVVLEEGSNIFLFFVRDGDDNVTSTIEREIIRDTIAPNIPIIFFEQTDFVTSTLYMSWQHDEEQVWYDVEMRVGEGEWKSLFQDTTTTSYSFIAEQHTIYTIRVRAYDEYGQYSLWSDEKIVMTDWSKDIVIDEVMWAGSGKQNGACASGEWIELYNPGDGDIVVDGWSVVVESSGKNISIPLSGVIYAQQYYLIENGEKAIGRLSADALFPKNTTLSDSGARIVIFNNNQEIVDELDQMNGWLAGSESGTSLYSMARKDVGVAGIEVGNWQTSAGLQYHVSLSCGNSVYATPQQENDAWWYLPYDIVNVYGYDENNTLTLTSEHSPYVFNREIYIPAGYTLHIENGVTIISLDDDAGFHVDGNLIIQGDEDSHVVITSLSDTTINNVCEKGIYHTMCSDSAGAGQWRSIVVGDDALLDLSYTDLYYAGAEYYYQKNCKNCRVSQVIRNEGGRVILHAVSIEHAYKKFVEHTQDSFIYASGGIVDIQNSIFRDGCRAIRVEQNTDISLQKNLFEYFDTTCAYPVTFDNTLPRIWSDNIFAYNNNNAFYFEHTVFDRDMSFDATNVSILSSSRITASSTVTLLADAHIMFSPYAVLHVEGSLRSQGTASSPVVISSASDNMSFSGIFVDNGILSLLHTTIDGGGRFANISQFPFSSQESAVLWCDSASLTLDSVAMNNARRPGSYMQTRTCDMSISDSRLGWDSDYKKLSSWRDNGINVFNSTLFLDNTTFQKMDFVVNADNNSQVTSQHMAQDNFVDLYDVTPYSNWFPTDLFSFEQEEIVNEEEVVQEEHVVEENIEEDEVIEKIVVEDGEQVEAVHEDVVE